MCERLFSGSGVVTLARQARSRFTRVLLAFCDTPLYSSEPGLTLANPRATTSRAPKLQDLAVCYVYGQFTWSLLGQSRLLTF